MRRGNIIGAYINIYAFGGQIITFLTALDFFFAIGYNGIMDNIFGRLRSGITDK